MGKYTCEGTGKFWEPGGMYNNILSWDLNYEYESGVKLRFMSSDIAQSKDVWKYRKMKDKRCNAFERCANMAFRIFYWETEATF